MKRHVENALAIAEFLIEAPEVSWVRYPDLEGHPDKDLAKKLLPHGKRFNCNIWN